MGGPDRRPEAGAGAATVPLVEQADPRLGPEFASRIARYRSTMQGNHELSYLAHYTGNVWDFAVDRLGGLRAVAADLDWAREAYQRMGRLAVHQVGVLDHQLRPLRTGSLIRVVVHGRDGVLFFVAVVPGESVLGISTDAGADVGSTLSTYEPVRRADRAVGALADRLRSEIGQMPHNPGGWLTEHQPADQGQPVEATATEPVVLVEGGGHGGGEGGGHGGESGAVRDACRAAVRPEDLHYVAVYRGGKLLFSADVFDDPQVSHHFTQAATQARRQLYGLLGREFDIWLGQLARIVIPAVGEDILRVVLDVEQGAAYLYREGPGDYLLGVTLDQSRVSQADDATGALAAVLAERRGDSGAGR